MRRRGQVKTSHHPCRLLGFFARCFPFLLNLEAGCSSLLHHDLPDLSNGRKDNRTLQAEMKETHKSVIETMNSSRVDDTLQNGLTEAAASKNPWDLPASIVCTHSS